MKLEQMIDGYLSTIKGPLYLRCKKFLPDYLDYLSTSSEGTIDYQNGNYASLHDEDAVKQDLVNYLRARCNSDQSKTNALECINRFWDYAHEQWNFSWINPDIKVPSSPFERQIELVKYMQGKKVSIDDLCSHFGYSERTIKEDLSAIRGEDGLWECCPVKDIGSVNRTITYECSIQPFFLALNLTHTAELFRALEHLEQTGYQGNSFIAPLKEQLTSQLTLYGVQQMQKADINLEPVVHTHFIPESHCQEDLHFMLIKALKEDEPVNIIYQDENGEEKEERVLVKPGKQHKFFFFKVGNKSPLPIKEEQVIRVIPHNRRPR